MGTTGAALAAEATLVEGLAGVLGAGLSSGLGAALGGSATAALMAGALAETALVVAAALGVAAAFGVAGDEAGTLAVVLLTSGLLAVAMYLIFATACESAASLEARGL